MYDDVKKQLIKNFDSAAPDLLSEIMSAKIEKIETEEVLFSELLQDKRSTHGNRSFKYASFVAAAVFVCLITAFFFQKQHVTYTVTLEDESKIILYMNRSNSVVKVTTIGETSINVDDIKGKQLDEGLELALDALEKESAGQNKKIEITYTTKNQSGEVLQTINDVSQKYADDKGCQIHTNEETGQLYSHNDGNSSMDILEEEPVKTCQDQEQRLEADSNPDQGLVISAEREEDESARDDAPKDEVDQNGSMKDREVDQGSREPTSPLSEDSSDSESKMTDKEGFISNGDQEQIVKEDREQMIKEDQEQIIKEDQGQMISDDQEESSKGAENSSTIEDDNVMIKEDSQESDSQQDTESLTQKEEISDQSQEYEDKQSF